MAEPTKPGNPSQDRLLVKVILPKQGKERKISGGGTPPVPFRSVTPGFRHSLSNRLTAIRQSIQSPNQPKIVPVRVRLLKKALAKSHRPEMIFSNQTCPIIGAGKLGEIFIKGTDTGLLRVNRLITSDARPQVVKEISSIETIEPVTPEFRRKGLSSDEILRDSPRTSQGFAVKIELFNLGDEDQATIVKDFLEKTKQAGIEVLRRGYSEESFYFEASCKSVSDVDALSRIVGVKSVKKMPVLRTIRGKSVDGSSLPGDLVGPDRDLSSYPVVAVVDSGIDSSISALERWVIGRQSSVAPNYRNPYHGTFVAGLITFGNQLNPELKLDGSHCAVFDLQVMPNDDPQNGDIDSIQESELLQDLEQALSQHANEIKVWNLSLGTNEVCSLDEFSSFAVELDRLQEKYNVSFVISAGNYNTVPLLDYPRNDKQLEDGRITTPADSVLGITVGAISHVTHKSNGPKAGELSAFSRHGAGPNHIIKPDLVHYGGTCATDGSDFHGVRSIHGSKTVTDMGTSFSTPLVSRTLANVYHQITPTPSPVLARAIMTHHARHPGTRGRIPDREENFFGFGLPCAANECLECTPWTSTLVFEDILRPGYYLEWDDFPYPDSLKKNGRYFGDVWMTVAFSPARGNRWGTEYCETHVDASFGVYYWKKSRKTKERSLEFRGLVPPEHKNAGALYESYQVETLRKWAPVRTYFGSMEENGERGERWRLRVRLLSRHGIQDKLVSNPQKFALIVTISDPTKKGDIYNEMALRIRNRFQAQNLTVRSTVRLQQQ